MVRHPKPPSQTWRTFLDNHMGCLASIDFFVVPTATFAVLFVFIVLRHERRRIEHFGVTETLQKLVLRRFKWIPDQISLAMASKGGRAAGSPPPHG